MSCTGGTGIDMVPNAALAWVPCTVETDGQTWKSVAFRLKGNSSLTQAWAGLVCSSFPGGHGPAGGERFHPF